MKLSAEAGIMKINFVLDKIPAAPWLLLKFGLLILAFGLILWRTPSSLMASLDFSMRVGFWPVIPIAAILVYLLFRIPGRMGSLLAFGGVMVMFAMPLAGLWSSGHTQSSVISGLIQLNDASGYYTDALRLSVGENFSFFSSRRPLFPAFLSFLLVITGHNLMTTLIILSAITAVCCYLMAREIQVTHGTEAAVFLLMMVFLYYRLHSGITMSENFGIALGCLGFTILWRGVAQKQFWLVWFGIFSSTLALNARAGAFFVLPFLVIFAGWLFRESKPISWRAIFLSSGAIVLGFFCSLLLGRLIGQTGGIPFANFSYTLYSLAAGGKSWAYIAEVHPQVFLLSEPEHTKRVFQLAFELMQQKPMQTIEGALFFWKALFTDTLYHVFSFVSRENWVLHPFVKWGLYFLSIMGLVAWFKDRKSPLNNLVMICIIGIFLSVPLAPPTDSFRIRPYASSIGMICMLPALGVAQLGSWMKLQAFANVDLQKPSNPALPFNLLLIALTLIAPLIIKNASSLPEIAPAACGLGSQPVGIFFSKGTYINVAKNTEDFIDWPPNYHAYLFQKNAHGLENVNLIAWLESVKPLHSLLVALDVIHMDNIMLILPTELLPKENGYVQFCGNFDESIRPYSIFKVSESIPDPLQ
jgi:hypothetical protein